MLVNSCAVPDPIRSLVVMRIVTKMVGKETSAAYATPTLHFPELDFHTDTKTL